MSSHLRIVLITLMILGPLAFLLIANQESIVNWLPLDDDMKLVLNQSGVFIWLVIAPIIYLGALVGIYLPRIKKLKTTHKNS